jgi:hypothetical protein
MTTNINKAFSGYQPCVSSLKTINVSGTIFAPTTSAMMSSCHHMTAISCLSSLQATNISRTISLPIIRAMMS